ELDVLPAVRAKGLGFLPYFPLASGLLTGKYRRGEPPPEGSRLANRHFAAPLTDDNLALVERLQAYAEERGRTLLELAFSWLLAQPGLASVIAGATKPAQVMANVEAADWALSAAEMAEVAAIL